MRLEAHCEDYRRGAFYFVQNKKAVKHGFF